jgi:dienelactone hydrolase
MQAVADAITHASAPPGAGGQPVGLIGFSLGAYLALSVAAQDARVGAVVECLGGLPGLLAPGLRTMPPVLILHGGADPLVPVSEARALVRLLRDRGLLTRPTSTPARATASAPPPRPTPPRGRAPSCASTWDGAARRIFPLNRVN